jgi:hypothetical protein
MRLSLFRTTRVRHEQVVNCNSSSSTTVSVVSSPFTYLTKLIRIKALAG